MLCLGVEVMFWCSAAAVPQNVPLHCDVATRRSYECDIALIMCIVFVSVCESMLYVCVCVYVGMNVNAVLEAIIRGYRLIHCLAWDHWCCGKEASLQELFI